MAAPALFSSDGTCMSCSKKAQLLFRWGKVRVAFGLWPPLVTGVWHSRTEIHAPRTSPPIGPFFSFDTRTRTTPWPLEEVTPRFRRRKNTSCSQNVTLRSRSDWSLLSCWAASFGLLRSLTWLTITITPSPSKPFFYCPSKPFLISPRKHLQSVCMWCLVINKLCQGSYVEGRLGTLFHTHSFC